ncbi:hypothetical protein PHYBLDRAFT_147599 [Phycomyces blakesleeanus NRRL 1555(-)]|uniref:Uncharacterized protein n=1 Tax=Phycomyces blakesleeanus (strain ATCC 8743b / DSM 1359 / FGSC 10004 / NBRC 33097 / NRRL 1555) TaxID=763407 RepID=A0A167M586_PHYB8|nr:hypothetical protein PHYBLDRAFT_147599 [Phycomyces blakesleeanus NRRL 1555(-)]OAD71839.1 hypothetical protein PHYBLDRAFT_147599 [Phycomyces blakesleeanus NRRL 1555(-)]|eukprot:XP_018289879.1 hypothetical protein PHYBLDRAFT_147599 [Phycomyces blakesleeanus NRRL 1555(-)]
MPENIYRVPEAYSITTMASTNRYFLITNIESLFLSPLFGLSPKAQPYTLTWIPENRALAVKAKHTNHHLDPFVIVVIYRPNISSHWRTFFSSLTNALILLDTFRLAFNANANLCKSIAAVMSEQFHLDLGSVLDATGIHSLHNRHSATAIYYLGFSISSRTS